MKQRAAMVAFGILAMLAGVSPFGADSALTNEDVVRLTEAGLGPVVIIAKIESSQTDFDTSVDQLVALGQAGVDNAVIAAMVEASKATTGAGTAVSAPATPTRTSGADVTVDATPAGTEGAAQPRAIPGSTFRERLGSGGEGPEMVVIPAGSFRMGCLSNDSGCVNRGKPVHEVRIPVAFALSVHEVTFDDYDRFTYPNKVDDEGRGRGSRPAIKVSWDDAKEYVAWLSGETGADYRLPSEAEWEYAARAESTTKYSWGNEIGSNRANCHSDHCGDQWKFTSPVGSFRPNGFGLYDMHGNVWEWVEDCWNVSYSGAPSDGSPWLRGDCAKRVLRGGSWINEPWYLRAASRLRNTTGSRSDYDGFRVARTLTP